MFVDNVKLLNFRNYEYGKVAFNPGANFIYGSNASGKTNVIESIYLAATTKSHRFSKDKEMIMYDKESSKISVSFNSSNRLNRSDIILNNSKKKQLFKNGVPITKSSEMLGFLNVVLFCPDDLRLIKGSPRERRRMIDMGICQLRASYFNALINYNHILEQKNNLLKINPESDQIWIWNHKLCEYGGYISYIRQNYIKNINKYAQAYHSSICKERLHILYNSGIGSISEELTREEFTSYMEKEIEKNTDREIKNKLSIIGPHRDDFTAFLDDKEAKIYGSQGQQRTISICLKLAEVDIIKIDKRESPVLLLDDALGELDSKRQQFVLKNFDNIQTIITGTKQLELENIKNINMIKVEDIHVHSFG
ncbi:MAG: DNA replication/repair protein RecF [Eubacteriales bacterium]|nr:DNA replication/repair protein RecF [Eubacteriales bacterium]